MYKKRGAEAVFDDSCEWEAASDVRAPGDETFYRENVIPLYKDLYLFLRAFTNDSEAAKDIAQITMERAWTKIDWLKKRDRVKAWLFQIARNASSTYYTSKKTMIMSSGCDPEYDMKKISDERMDALQIILDRERSSLIVKALDRVDPRFKTVVQLWALGDLTQKRSQECSASITIRPESMWPGDSEN